MRFFAVILAAGIVFATSAASATYRYTSGAWDTFSYYHGPVPAEGLTGMPTQDFLSIEVEADLAPSTTVYFDDVAMFSGQYQARRAEGMISTDASGAIVDWLFYTTTGGSDYLDFRSIAGGSDVIDFKHEYQYAFDCPEDEHPCVSAEYLYAEASNGDWVIVSTPLPGGALLLMSGLAAFALQRRNRPA